MPLTQLGVDDVAAKDLAEMSPRQYLQRFHVEFYLRDLLCAFSSRRRGDSRNAPDFIGQYFDAVLRGEHILHRSFSYINGTPLNRRSFVSLLRRALCGMTDPELTALTAYDFHDFVKQLCADFPLRLVEEAARHAERAGKHRHYLLGETRLGDGGFVVPAGPIDNLCDIASPEEAQTRSERGGSGGDGPALLLMLASLQRLVEFCLVYAEVLCVLKLIFRTVGRQQLVDGEVAGHADDGGPRGDGMEDVMSRVVTRLDIVAELRCRADAGGSLVSCAIPSEHALLRFLDPSITPVSPKPQCVAERGMTAISPVVTYGQALIEMADSFELTPEPYPDDLLGDVGSLYDDTSYESSEPVGSRARPKSSADKRRREKKTRPR